MQNPDVLIVGGGIVGAACARALASRRLAVHVYDGQREGAATTASAGMLAPLVETAREDPMLAISVRARDLYQNLVPDLAEETGIDAGLWTEGILQLAFSEQDASRMKGEVAWKRQQGFSSEWLDREDVQAACPGVSDTTVGAVLASEDGALNPAPLLEALLSSAERRGALLFQGDPADGLSVENGRVTGIRIGPRTVAAGIVVLAAGAWSGRLMGLPRPVSVEPIRGQMAALAWPEDHPASIVYAAGGYLLKRGSEALVGSTMEHVGFDSSTTAEGLAKVLGIAERIFPSLAGKSPRRSWAGLRPMTPDGAPLVGRDPTVKGLWYATGHGRNGILLAGLTGEVLARMVVDERLEYDYSPMDPGRFWRW